MGKKKNYAPIDDAEHVVRFCHYQKVERDIETEEIRGVFPQAFELRTDINEQYLSVNHLEHCQGGVAERLAGIVGHLRSKLHPDAMVAGAGVAILNSKRVKDIGARRGLSLRVLGTPNRDPSYARVTGLPLANGDTVLLTHLANEASLRLHLIAEIDAVAAALGLTSNFPPP